MENEFERLIKKCNSNEEARSACDKDPRLSEALRESLEPTIDLLKETFLRLSMARTEFKLYEPASKEELNSFSEFYDIFDEGISMLKSKNNLHKYPIFKKNLDTHIIENLLFSHF